MLVDIANWLNLPLQIGVGIVIGNLVGKWVRA